MDQLDHLGPLSAIPTLNERRTTADHVAKTLRDGIQSGLLEDGIELNQVAIAEHFGISRVPVREALRSLEAEGWITARAHQRAVVQAVSPARVDQIFEVRSLLEARLIGSAIRHIDGDRTDELFALCDAMDGMGEHNEWVAANRQFHRRLLESSGADMIVELVEQLTSQVERYLRWGGNGPMRESQAGAEHRAILAAVVARDVRKARNLVRTHIDNTRSLIMAAIGKAHAARRLNP